MDCGFALSATVHFRGSFIAGRVCTAPSLVVPVAVRKNQALLRMIGDAPSPENAQGTPDMSTAALETVSEVEKVDDGSVAVVDIPEVDDELDFDESEIIPCEPPQPFINAKNIADIREKFKIHPTDSGSPEFQIATLTIKIAYITEHLKKNRKDHSSTRGLIKMVSTRRRLLKYVKRQDPKRFDYLVTELNIRVSQNLRSV